MHQHQTCWPLGKKQEKGLERQSYAREGLELPNTRLASSLEVKKEYRRIAKGEVTKMKRGYDGKKRRNKSVVRWSPPQWGYGLQCRQGSKGKRL